MKAPNAGQHRNQTIHFIDELCCFNEVPERINKNLVLCSLYFTRFITNKAQFNTGFSERSKLKADAVRLSDPIVMSQHKCE